MTAREMILSLPERFNADAAGGKETVFHFDIAGDNGGQYTVTVKDGKCEVQEGLDGEAKCKVRSSDKTLEKILSGKGNAQMAVFTGKLKISNLGEMMSFGKPFGFM